MTPNSDDQTLIRRHALPAVAFALHSGAPGRSRLGGAPLLPPGFEWPVYTPEEREFPQGLIDLFGAAPPKAPTGPQPLDFLLQVDLTELRALAPAGVLPSEGLLTFFYDAQNQPWGYDPKHRDGFRVVSIESEPVVERLPPRRPPFAAHGLQFWRSLTLPHCGSRAYEVLSGAEQLPEHYLELADALEREDYPEGSGLHRLLGYSANIQGDMQREAQLVSSGIYCGAPSDDPRILELEQGADDWLLLLQLDSEDAPGIMWGDAGMLYFWIRKTDLAARRFDCAWMTLQCG